MEIKTITCHEVYNHGASLQEYALLQFLQSLGHNAEAIHYKPDYLSQHFKLGVVANPKYKSIFFLKCLYLLAKLPGRIVDLKRKKEFDTFSKKYLKVTTRLYKTNEDLKKNVPDADVFICGSDQIWNSFFQNGKDPAFYLNFVPDGVLKISYAASFAIDELEETLKSFVKKNVKRIQYVSVRETSGVKILNDLGIENVVQVLDPVFLLSAEYWKDTFVKEFKEDYIFVYDFDSNSIVKELVLKISKERGLKIITVNKNIKYAHKNYYLKGPEMYLTLMNHAELVVTNSFHSVAFSLLFEKQFVVVNRLEKINTRMRDLLALVGLSDLLISDVKNFKNTSINYEMVNKKLTERIIASKIFLENAINKQEEVITV